MDNDMEKEIDEEIEAVAVEEDLESLLQRIDNERDGEDSTAKFFTITSDIGKDDYRAFVYYSVLRKSRWVLPAYIILPPLVSLSFGFADGAMNIPLALGITGILYLVIAGMVVFRTERSLSKSNKKNPDLMKLTPTTFTFLSSAVINAKKGGEIRVPYKNLWRYCETKKRVILYFAGKKAMIIRKEDIERDADFKKFQSFIKDQINKNK